jgi:hypothetical protein
MAMPLAKETKKKISVSQRGLAENRATLASCEAETNPSAAQREL